MPQLAREGNRLQPAAVGPARPARPREGVNDVKSPVVLKKSTFLKTAEIWGMENV